MRVLVVTVGLTVACASWVDDESLKQKTSDVITKPAGKYKLNLDLPQTERWNDISAEFKDSAYLIREYLQSQLPAAAYDPLVKIAAAVEPYFVDYGDEMKGLAAGLGLELGEIVATNLVYQLERIGVNCSNWNSTGPTLSDDAIMRGLSCEEWTLKREAMLQTGPEGLCTSIVSQDSGGGVQHGRNLDWNIPETLKGFVIDLDVYQGGELLYTGTGCVGFVGILNGMRRKGERWTVSQNARNHGGRVPVNFLDALLTHALTPEQAIRKTLEGAAGAQGFEAALQALATVPIIDDVYYTMAGEGSGDAAVVTRRRNAAADVWRLGTDPDTPPHGEPREAPFEARKALKALKAGKAGKAGDATSWWWLAETNYDHWKRPPVADDRIDPANEYMEALGSAAGTDQASMFNQVLSTWPVFNPHTTFTTMMNPRTGAYNTSVWYGNFV